VQAPTKYEFLINLKTASLRPNVPPTLLALADEVSTAATSADVMPDAGSEQISSRNFRSTDNWPTCKTLPSATPLRPMVQLPIPEIPIRQTPRQKQQLFLAARTRHPGSLELTPVLKRLHARAGITC
jgi:hypothetical protein